MATVPLALLWRNDRKDPPSPQCDKALRPDPWHDRMVDAGVRNDPAAFREALKEWEQAGLKALKRIKGNVA
ncbi:MAG: hypothetical protein M3315_06910 [Actinomycetota bacterium]|nr:hypothetical protein [Actinomycetota bacterium]